MKYFIVGKHASGKHQVLDLLTQMDGIRTGREFCTIPEPPAELYIDQNYEVYSIDDVNKIFETRAYLHVGSIQESVIDAYSYYRGFSFYTIDNSDVVVLSPRQVVEMNRNIINDDICFVWLDNTSTNRIHRYASENRKYDFYEIEELESVYDNEFVKSVYGLPGSSVIYFNNEEPERVAVVIASQVIHPDLHEMFVSNFK